MKLLRNILIVFSLLAVAGCGGGSTYKAQEAINAPDDLGELTDTEKLLFSDGYAGHLVLFLNETLGARLDGNRRLYSRTNYDTDLSLVQQVLDAHSGAVIKRSVSTDPDKLDARRAELEELSGKTLKDFNSIYHIYISDPDEGVRLMRELRELGVVENIYPRLSSIGAALVDTPDLTPHQGYLYAELTHGGLNAVAAWNAGVRGEGVVLVDGDVTWNVNHEDLDINHPEFTLNGIVCTDITNPICQDAMSHGTAMVGIMAALDNGHGVTGIAPNVDIHGASLDTGIIDDFLIRVTDGEGTDLSDELVPGTIIAMIKQMPGANNQPNDCAMSQVGCIPVEADPAVHAAMQYAIAAGITIITASANGSQDLDDQGAYHSWQLYLPSNDIGTVMVGASNGAPEQKLSASNYGTVVDLFAWGQNVATTSFPVSTLPNWTWQGTTTPLPPVPMDTDAFFVDVAGGTSAASAQIGGVAALVQSYAKQQMGTTRYLMPAKMKDILVQSGVPQVGNGGNIGVQPRVDVAMGLVDTAWNAWSATYPELITDQPLTTGEIATLRQNGLGIICVDGDPAASDPTCPDNALWTPGSGIAEPLDFEGDGRADLVQWSDGQFKIDLSSVGGDVDGFGAWDVIVNYPTTGMSDTVWPYVEDMNSDGRTDLVLYDKDNGTWYISYTNSAMLASGSFNGWTIVQTNVADTREMDPWNSMYCRPHPGDYDGDGWVDLAVACSDGIWYIGHSNASSFPANLVYDRQVVYLTAQGMQGLPGWAFMTSTTDFMDRAMNDIVVKYPDGHPNAGVVFAKASPNFAGNLMNGVALDFGGNDKVLLAASFTGGLASVSVKEPDGRWLRADPNLYQTLDPVQPGDIYGGLDCHPIGADFDGDGEADHAVMCPDEWRIAYSGEDYPQFKNNWPNYRHVDLTYDTGEFSLPGRSYAGGISYETALHLLEMFQGRFPNDPPPILIDMVSIQACQRVNGNECQ